MAEIKFEDDRMTAAGPDAAGRWRWLLCHLGTRQRRALMDLVHGSARAVPEDGDLFYEGDAEPGLFWIVDGWVSLHKLMRDGRRQIIDLLLPGDVVSPTGADGRTAYCGATAMTNALVAKLSIETLVGTPAGTPAGTLTGAGLPRDAVEAALARQSAGQMARRMERMLRLGQASAFERVGHALLELCVRLHPHGSCQDRHFHLPITQREVGELVGLSSVHVCRTLRRLERLGVIAQRDHDIVIRRVDELEAIASVTAMDLKALTVAG